jgi:hypothetical protein
MHFQFESPFLVGQISMLSNYLWLWTLAFKRKLPRDPRPGFFFHFSTQFRFLMNGSKSLRIYIWLRIHWDIQYDKKWIFGEQMTPRKPSLQWHLRTTPKLFSRCHCHHGNHWQWSETFLLRQWHRGNRCKRIYFHLFEFEPIKWLWVVILTK